MNRNEKILVIGCLLVSLFCALAVIDAKAYTGPVNITAASVNNTRVDPSAPVEWLVGPVYNGTTGNPVQNGWGMDFNGSGDNIQISDAASLNIENTDSTFSFILRPRDQGDASPVNRYFYYKGATSRVFYTADTDRITVSGNTTSYYVIGEANFNDKLLFVDIVVNNGGNILYYINSTLVKTDNIHFGFVNVAQDAFIGSQDGTSRYYNGTMYEFKLYSRALGPGEIQYHFQNKVPLDQTDLELWIDFDQQVQDQTANGNDGTINGNPVYVRGIRGKAGIVLDGTGDYVTVTGPFANGAYSYSTWIKILDTGNQYILDATGGGGTGTITWNANIVTASSGTVYVDNVATTTLAPNNWHFLSVRGITINAPVSIILGADNAGANALNGTLDHGSLYNRTITLAENTEQYQGIYNNTGRFCLLDYDNNVNDQSGSGNNGAASGDPEYSDGLANCPLTSSYDGNAGGTTISLVNSTTGLAIGPLPSTAPNTWGTYNATIYPPTLVSTANYTYAPFIVDHYNISVYALYTEVEAGFRTLLYANGSSVIDGHELTKGDTLNIQGTAMTWNDYLDRFEATYTEATATIVTYNTLTALLETTYGITNGSIVLAPTVLYTTPSLDLIIPFMRVGDWPGAIIEINVLLMGQTLFWTFILAAISMGIYDYAGAEVTIAVWILGWSMFANLIHGEANTIALIMTALAGGIYIAKFFLDRRTSV